MSQILVTACLPELHQEQGEYLLYEHSDGYHPCGGTAKYLDTVVPFLAQQLAVEIPGPLRYSWLADEDIPWVIARYDTSYDLGGSAIGLNAWGREPILIHEVAHLVAGGRDAPIYFKEGLAVMMDPLGWAGREPRYSSDTDYDPLATMTVTNGAELDYGAAGRFTTFLFVRHGPDRYREFYRSLVWPGALADIEDRFRSAFGVELAAEVETFRRGVPPCPPDSYNLQLAECTGSLHTWDEPDRWMVTETMACDDPEVIGGTGDDGSAYRSFRLATVEVPEAGEYVLSYQSSDEAWVRFGPCFGCPWDFRDVQLREPGARSLQLEPGKHYLRINSISDRAPDVEVRLERI